MITATVWLTIAYVLGLLVRMIGLPPLVGYLGAGFALESFQYNGGPVLEHVAHAGVLLLLFSVGLKLRLKSLLRAEVWGGATLHMALTGLFAMVILALGTGLSLAAAGLIAVALSFSSTVVAAKVLESKKELRAFHGRVAIGILIMQDLVAVALLSIVGGASPSWWALLLPGVFFARPLIYRLIDLSGHDELLILFGLLLAMVVGGASFEEVGLSSELGALILGAIVSGHRRASEISNVLWGIKEVLLVGFFLQIGLSGNPTLESFGYALLLCLLLPLKAALFFFVLLLFRLRARSSFLAGLTLATYSEFALILVNVGVHQGMVPADWLVILAVAVALSFAVTAPLNRYAHDLYSRFEHVLGRFESKRRHPDDEPIHLGSSRIVIMGMGRVGSAAYDFFTQRQQRVVGLDSDPGKVEWHRQAGRRVLYADAEDPGFWLNLSLEGVEAILLAVPDFEAKTISAKQLRKAGFKGTLSATAVFNEEVAAIRGAGADFVYNYFDTVGVGFAEHVWLQLTPDKPAEVASSARPTAGMP